MKKITILFILVSSFAFSQNNVKVDLSNPNATLYTFLYFLMPDSYDVAKASTTIKGLPKKEANAKVIKIKAVLDGKGLKVDFTKIPENADYLDTLSVGNMAMEKSLNRFAPFPLRLPEVYIEKIGSRWYFSKETLEKIDDIYSDTFALEFSWLEKKYPEVFKKSILGILIWKPMGVVLVLIICFALYFILSPIVFFILKNIQKLLLRKPKFKSFDLLHELTRPIVFILLLKFIKKILPSLKLIDLNAYLVTGIKIAETVFWIFVFLKLMKLILGVYIDLTKKTRTKLDRQLAPILNKLLMGFIVFIGFLHILTLFGVAPATVLAGASIGGIAVAFAAQDSVKNLIGTIVIFLDKPFRLDDWVVIGGVEGSVEKVGFRSTRIRAADTTIYQIPNSLVSEAEINNKGLRIFRRYTTELGVRYDTPPELIEAFVNGIRAIIIAHPNTRSQSYNVEFSGFGDSALLIMVNVYFNNLDWGGEQTAKHRFHMGIVRLAAALGVEFAFPSSTLMIEQLPGQESLAAKYNTDKKEIDEKIKAIVESFKKMDHSKDPNASSLPGG